MDCVREAVCRLCSKEKVSDIAVMKKAMRTGEKGHDMDVMEEAMSLGEYGHLRWQMKPLCDATQSGALVWVRVGYLKELRNQGGRLRRRQDILPQYFLTAEEVGKQALFAVTHKWLSEEHPDPDGFHLARLVDVLTNEKADDDDGVFFDWSSLYQKPRSEHEERLFKEGLRALIQCVQHLSGGVHRSVRVARRVLRSYLLAERVVLRGIPPVDILPTNCQCEGPVRQRTHGSRVARGMERAAVHDSMKFTNHTDRDSVEDWSRTGPPSCPPQELTRSVSWSPAPWRISDS